MSRPTLVVGVEGYLDPKGLKDYRSQIEEQTGAKVVVLTNVTALALVPAAAPADTTGQVRVEVSLTPSDAQLILKRRHASPQVPDLLLEREKGPDVLQDDVPEGDLGVDDALAVGRERGVVGDLDVGGSAVDRLADGAVEGFGVRGHDGSSHSSVGRDAVSAASAVRSSAVTEDAPEGTARPRHSPGGLSSGAASADTGGNTGSGSR